jgi:tetratricopeptide (TPR) repeat protein
MALTLRGWAAGQDGRIEDARDDIEEGLKREQATGASLYEPYAQALLAEVYIKNGRYDEAVELLQKAARRIDRQDSEYFYAAEIYRLSGEAQLRSGGDLDQAERHFSRGIAIARKQEAKSFELKLAVSLYELHETRQSADKYQLPLLEIFRSFGEGFDTTDLVRAEDKLKTAGLV